MFRNSLLFSYFLMSVNFDSKYLLMTNEIALPQLQFHKKKISSYIFILTKTLKHSLEQTMENFYSVHIFEK